MSRKIRAFNSWWLRSSISKKMLFLSLFSLTISPLLFGFIGVEINRLILKMNGNERLYWTLLGASILMVSLSCLLWLMNNQFASAIKDPLTGLYNRFYFEETKRRVTAEARRQKAWLWVVYIDIDNLKTVNDEISHAAGDAIIKFVGEKILKIARESDVPVRLGGDEFVVIGIDDNPKAALLIAKRIETEIANSFIHFKGIRLSVCVSVGIASSLSGEEDVDKLSQRADEKMLEVKQLHHSGLKNEEVTLYPVKG